MSTYTYICIYLHTYLFTLRKLTKNIFFLKIPAEDGKCNPLQADSSLLTLGGTRRKYGKDRERKDDNISEKSGKGAGVRKNGEKGKSRKSYEAFDTKRDRKKKEQDHDEDEKHGKGQKGKGRGYANDSDGTRRRGKGKEKGEEDNYYGFSKGEKGKGANNGNDNDSGNLFIKNR